MLRAQIVPQWSNPSSNLTYVCMYVCMYIFISEWIYQNRSKKHQTQSEYRIHPTPPHPYPPHPYPPPAKMMKYMRRDAMKYGSDIYIHGQSIKQMTSLITTQDVHFYAKNKSPLTCKSKTYSTHPLTFDYTNPFATHPWKSRQLSCMWLLAMTLSPLHFLWPDSYEGGQCLLSIENYAMSIELSFPKACFWH